MSSVIKIVKREKACTLYVAITNAATQHVHIILETRYMFKSVECHSVNTKRKLTQRSYKSKTS